MRPPPSCGHVGEERQHRQGDRQRHQARHDQHLERVERHHPEGVDLLAHVHRADLGGDRRAGSAGDHDRGHQHAELPQAEHADQIDRIGRGAETRELEDALLGDDRADEKIDQRDDRHAAQRIHLEVIHHRGPAPAHRMQGEPRPHHDDLAEIVDDVDEVVAGRVDRLADRGEQHDRVRCADGLGGSSGRYPAS